MKRALAAFSLILFLSAYAAGQTIGGEAKSTANANDETAIRKVLADFVEAWNKHDAKAFSMVFAEDADFTNVRGASCTGRSSIALGATRTGGCGSPTCGSRRLSCGESCASGGGSGNGNGARCERCAAAW